MEKNYTNLIKDTHFYRNEILNRCNSEEEKFKYREMWSKEDSMREISDSIRSLKNKRGLFGFLCL